MQPIVVKTTSAIGQQLHGTLLNVSIQGDPNGYVHCQVLHKAITLPHLPRAYVCDICAELSAPVHTYLHTTLHTTVNTIVHTSKHTCVQQTYIFVLKVLHFIHCETCTASCNHIIPLCQDFLFLRTIFYCWSAAIEVISRNITLPAPPPLHCITGQYGGFSAHH